MQRMAWKDIQEHYPNQWVGLRDVEWDAKHCPITAEVIYTDKSLKEMVSELLNKDTLIMPVHTDPRKYLAGLPGEYMTYEEMQKKYPDRSIGVTDVHSEDCGATISSGKVILTELSKDELSVIRFGLQGYMRVEYTTPNHSMFIGTQL